MNFFFAGVVQKQAGEVAQAEEGRTGATAEAAGRESGCAGGPGFVAASPPSAPQAPAGPERRQLRPRSRVIQAVRNLVHGLN